MKKPEPAPARDPSTDFSRYADMFAAIGAEPRLRILRLLLAAHPEGLTVGAVQSELGIPNSTLSHHLEKLRHEGLVVVRRDRQFLWYAANADGLKELLSFLYAECCSRTCAVQPESIIVPLGKIGRRKKHP